MNCLNVFDYSVGSGFKGLIFYNLELLKQNLVFKILHVYTHTNKSEILPC